MINIEDKIEEMFRAGLQFGYSRSSRHPKMKEFISGIKNNIEIFDLNKTHKKIEEAKEFLKSLGKERKAILILGTKDEVKELVESSAKEIEAFYVNKRWIGGTFTNFKEIKKRIDHLNDLIAKKESGELDKYTKKEQMQIEKKVAKLKNFFSGVQKLEKIPSAMLVLDTKEEKIAIDEAKQIPVPVIGLMNSDCNPNGVDYIIPANDNALSSIKYIMKELVGAYKEGLSEPVVSAPEAEKEKEVEKT